MSDLTIASGRLRGGSLPLPPGLRPDTETGAGFEQILGQALADVNRLQTDAHEAAARLAAGQGNTLDVVVAVQKADVAFQLVVQIRNKLLEAYQDVMRMQV